VAKHSHRAKREGVGIVLFLVQIVAELLRGDCARSRSQCLPARDTLEA
jgi:hypothetical protein